MITKIYAEVLEQTAMEQFHSAMDNDFAVKGALMPDAHTGYSLPIGAVVATKDVIVPAWVGYDIGCGMCALKLDIDISQITEHKQAIFDNIYKSIPVGFEKNKSSLNYDISGLTKKGQEIAIAKKYELSLCSLGGGNHFIEIGEGEKGAVWIIIHSGSRGVGHGIASHYMTVASSDPSEFEKEFDERSQDVKKHNPDRYEDLKEKFVKKKLGKLKPREGHYNFHVDSQEGKDYIQDMNWCLEYALENRKQMMRRAIECIQFSVGSILWNFEELINRNHNHAVERDGAWIHRKGATHAEEGMLGVIPGNMRDGSFIVKGKGNPDSLYSSSHGAGRVLGRKEAKRVLNLAEFSDTMQNVTALVTEDTLDESPEAYKDIFRVMELQSDLVEVMDYVVPCINIKG